MHSDAPELQYIFTVEVRVTADSEEQARAQLDAWLTMGTRVSYAEKSCRHVIPGAWQNQPEYFPDSSTSLVPGERYELVHVGDLRPGDQIYLMAQRRTVLEYPWHPEEMRPDLLRIPMTDNSPEITKLGPPFEKDHLVPRLVRDPDHPGPDHPGPDHPHTGGAHAAQPERR